MFKNSQTVIILLICLVIGIGYYAWRQQKQALSELEYLVSSGVNVTFFLRTRPIIAVDREKQTMYLLSGKGEHTIEKVPLIEIKKMVFIEAPVNNQSDSTVSKSDTIQIKLKNGNNIRIGELRKTAQQSKEIFDEHRILTDKLSIQLRR